VGQGGPRTRILVNFESGAGAKDVFGGNFLSDMYDAMNEVVQFLKK